MSGYLAIFAARWKSLLQYRAAALGGLFTQSFFGIVRIMILEAFYRSSTAPQPMRFADVVGYVWLGQATLLLVPWRVDPDIGEQFRTGAVLVSSALSALMSISLFWTLSADGIQLLVSVGVTILGGLVIPLPLFPDWAQPILYNLPFAAVLDFPSRIYTGNIPVAAAPLLLARQLGWTLVLVALGRWLVSRGARRLVVQGG